MAARIAAMSSGSGTAAAGRAGVSVPEWPPASADCTASRSTPASAAWRASAADVTVCPVIVPTPRKASITSRPGMPKVNVTTGTGLASRTSIFPRQWSSSSTGLARQVHT